MHGALEQAHAFSDETIGNAFRLGLGGVCDAMALFAQPAGYYFMLEAFAVSTGAVAIGEIGDKTQLLALMLAARFKRPVPIILGILAATVVNHALAGLFGEWLRSIINPDMFRYGLGLCFIAVGVWALFPDKLEDETQPKYSHYGVFFATAGLFFMAEIGDKTQLATMMLAAKYDALLAVIAGTTLGMLIADVPAVLMGKAASPKIPLHYVRYTAAGIFILLGVCALFGLGRL